MDVARLHFEDRRAGLPALPQAEGRRQEDRTTQRQPGRALRVRCARLMNAIAPCMGTSRNHCSDAQKSKLTKK